jgi:acetylornithine deacetylase/succinyl-diaminopimelate desuccinylase-like protein
MDLRERIASLMSRVRPELAELVAIRSVADSRQFPPEECARAAQWVLDAFAGVGFSDARLAEMADGSQAVLGTRPGPDPDTPTCCAPMRSWSATPGTRPRATRPSR